MQLAAALTGCGDPAASHALSMRSSASDENCNSANRELSGLLSPGAAALALQRSQAGAPATHLSHAWSCMNHSASSGGSCARLQRAFDEYANKMEQLLRRCNSVQASVWVPLCPGARLQSYCGVLAMA